MFCARNEGPGSVPSPAGRGWPEFRGRGGLATHERADDDGLLPQRCCVENTRDVSDERPSPLAGEGGPKGRMRGTTSRTAVEIPGRSGGLSNPDGPRASRPPHLTAPRSVFPREGGRASSTRVGMLSMKHLKGRKVRSPRRSRNPTTISRRERGRSRGPHFLRRTRLGRRARRPGCDLNRSNCQRPRSSPEDRVRGQVGRISRIGRKSRRKGGAAVRRRGRPAAAACPGAGRGSRGSGGGASARGPSRRSGGGSDWRARAAGPSR